MKVSFKATANFVILILLSACGQAPQVTLKPSTTPLPPDSPIPIQSATPTNDTYVLPTLGIYSQPSPGISSPPTFAIPDGTNIPFPTPDPRIPTLIPTIDPNLVPDLLRKSISIQTLNSANEHNIQRITGWDYGFQQSPCNSYQWLDSNHLLLRPRTGQGMRPFMDGSTRGDLGSEPIVINLTTGNIWMRPPYSISNYEWDCDAIYWSRELGIIINPENRGSSYASHESVSTYTFDGKLIGQYWGKILGVSPKGTKILVDDDTIIDLSTGKITDLAWYINYDLELSSKLYWTSDETRVYRCCFYYADLSTGKSYNLEWSDLQGVDRKSISFTLRSPHIGGQWVRNDTYFFPTWSYMSDAGDPRLIFSPIEKKYYLIELPSTSGINPETMTYTFSPNGNYVWITGFSYADGSYYNFLVNLTNLESTPYDIPGNDLFWSPDSKFAWVNLYDSGGINILSVEKKILEPFPSQPTSALFWHPTDSILAFLTEKNQALTILNAKDMSIKEWTLPSTFDNLIWSPDGSHIALIATDGSLWQIDYPNMENLEQLTQPMPAGNIQWSPDGNSIAFTSGPDIYIVDTIK